MSARTGLFRLFVKVSAHAVLYGLYANIIAKPRSLRLQLVWLVNRVKWIIVLVYMCTVCLLACLLDHGRTGLPLYPYRPYLAIVYIYTHDIAYFRY